MDKELVEQLIALDGDLSIWDIEHAFYWNAPPNRMHKVVAHLDLYRSIVDIPGDVFELGVFRGNSFIRWATWRQLFETDTSRRLVGFDAYGPFPTDDAMDEGDLEFADKHDGIGEGLSVEQLEFILDRKGFGNFRLVKGDVMKTMPTYLDENPEARIAMLHLDVDVYPATAYALEACLPLMVRGGVIVVDDYTWVAGATRAIDELLERRPDLKLEKHPYYASPSFIRIP